MIPVVGDLSGSRALAAIGSSSRAEAARLGALRIERRVLSVQRRRGSESFAVNLGRLPRAEHSVVIRSVFGRFGWPRGGSVSQLHDVTDMLDGLAKGRFRYYDELINGGKITDSELA